MPPTSAVPSKAVGNEKPARDRGAAGQARASTICQKPTNEATGRSGCYNPAYCAAVAALRCRNQNTVAAATTANGMTAICTIFQPSPDNSAPEAKDDTATVPKIRKSLSAWTLAFSSGA